MRQTINGALVFNPGETSKTVNITTVDDKFRERDETFSIWVTMSGDGITHTSAKSVITIKDNDAAPETAVTKTLGSGDYGKTCADVGNAGNGANYLPWERQYWPKGIYSYDLFSVNSDVANGWNPLQGVRLYVCEQQSDGSWDSVEWQQGSDNAGNYLRRYRATARDDAQVAVVLSVPSDYAFKTQPFTIQYTKTAINPNWIRPGEGTSNLTTCAGGNVNEGQAFSCVLTLSKAFDQPMSVNYKVEATSSNTAANGDDFTRTAAGTVTFYPGETSKTVSVPTVGDKLRERDETFSIWVTSVDDGVTDTSAKTTVTIKDDDAAPETYSTVTMANSDRGKTCDDVGSAPYGAKYLPWGLQYWPKGIYKYQLHSYPSTYGLSDVVKVKFYVCEKQSDGTWDSVEWRDAIGAYRATHRDDRLMAVVLHVAADAPSGSFTLHQTKTSDLGSNWVKPGGKNTQTLSTSKTSINEGDAITATTTLGSPFDHPYTYTMKLLHDGQNQVDSRDYGEQTATITFYPGETSKSHSFNTTNDLLPEFDETATVKLYVGSGSDIIYLATKRVTMKDAGGDTLSEQGLADIESDDYGKTCADLNNNTMRAGFVAWSPQKFASGLYHFGVGAKELGLSDWGLTDATKFNALVCRQRSDASGYDLVSYNSLPAAGLTHRYTARIPGDTPHAVIVSVQSGASLGYYVFKAERAGDAPDWYGAEEKVVGKMKDANLTVQAGSNMNLAFTFDKPAGKRFSATVKLATTNVTDKKGNPITWTHTQTVEPGDSKVVWTIPVPAGSAGVNVSATLVADANIKAATGKGSTQITVPTASTQ